MRQHTTQGAGRDRRTGSGLALGAVVVAAAFVLAACGSSDSASDDTTTTKAKSAATSTTTEAKATTSTTAANDAGELDGKSFIATGVEGYEPVADSDLTITFDGGQMSVNGGCNTLGAGYTFTDGLLKWDGTPRATMMACSDALQAQDQWLTELFTKGVDAALDANTLTLTQGDVTITLDSVTEAPLTNTTWTLQSTIANDAVSSLPTDSEPATLTIDTDANVGVFAGCNRGSGTVDITDTTLTFSPLALTKMACEGTAGQIENQVVSVLDGKTTYTIEGDTLTIMNGTSGLVYQAG